MQLCMALRSKIIANEKKKNNTNSGRRVIDDDILIRTRNTLHRLP